MNTLADTCACRRSLSASSSPSSPTSRRTSSRSSSPSASSSVRLDRLDFSLRSRSHLRFFICQSLASKISPLRSRSTSASISATARSSVILPLLRLPSRAAASLSCALPSYVMTVVPRADRVFGRPRSGGETARRAEKKPERSSSDPSTLLDRALDGTRTVSTLNPASLLSCT